jgi:hypothetical protein
MAFVRNLALMALVITSVACGTVIIVDGTEIYEKNWMKATNELAGRVKFDLDCPADQVSFSLLKKVGRHAAEVGVEGCGKKGTYVRVIGHNPMGPGFAGPWVLNTSN